MSSIINNNNKREIAPETKQDAKKVKTSREISSFFRSVPFKDNKDLCRMSLSPLSFDDEINSDDEIGAPAPDPPAPPPSPVKFVYGNYVPETLKRDKFALENKPRISDAVAGYKQFEVVQVPKHNEKFYPAKPIYSASQLPEMVSVTVPKFYSTRQYFP